MYDYIDRNHLNITYNMTQFVVFIATEYITTLPLAQLLMESILLKTGLWSLIVVDSDNTFKGIFVEIVEALGTRRRSAGNHKDVGNERFHKFLNHATTIFLEERGSVEYFVECSMLSACTCNTNPIDVTDIILSVSAIGKELKFPRDINISKITTPVDSASNSVATYLRHVQTLKFQGNCLDSSSMIEGVSKERKKTKRLVTYKLEDVVMVCIVVQSKTEIGVVGKLVFNTCGLYIILY